MIHTYIGEKPLHTHERVGLENFLERLEVQWGKSDESITVIAHALWNGAEIDAVVLLPRAVAVIDFKDHGGRVQVSENGPWHGETGPIKGGSKANPYAQVRDNKRAVISWLEHKQLLSGCNLGHISGLVVFAHNVSVAGDLGPKIGTWFHITDLEGSVDRLASLASPQIRASEREVDSIVTALGVREYRSSRTRTRVVPIDRPDSEEVPALYLSERQQEVLDTIVRFLVDQDRASMSVLGMTHTGKTTLLSETVARLGRLGRQAIVLAPNRRIATSFHSERPLEAASIYFHLYDRGNPQIQKRSEHGDKGKQKIKVFPLRASTDPVDCVYLIDEAHLIGNDYFELDDGSRYGSGRLADDFLSFAEVKSSRRQVVLFGDPFQLPRGRPEGMLLFGEPQRARELRATEVSLREMFEDASRAVPLSNARRLALAIQDGRFAELHFESGDGFSVLSRAAAADQVTAHFHQQPLASWYIADTHTKTTKFNHWIRRQLFGEHAMSPVVGGDLLEFYSGENVSSSPFEATAPLLVSGDRVIVEVPVASAICRVQSLSRGKEKKSIQFATRQIDVNHHGSRHSLSLLEEFLVADKPDLEPETAVAVDVWQDRNRELPISRLRYGYATTCHHAQGMSQEYCFVDAGYEGGRHTEAYFRWLYTAITRSSRHCFVHNFSVLDPFDETQWSDRGAQVVSSLPIGFGWRFSLDNTKSGAVTDAAPASSRSHGQTAVETIKGKISRLVEPLGWRLIDVDSQPYQEQIHLMASNATKVRLMVSYNRDQEVTGMRVSDSSVGGELLICLAEAAARTAIDDAVGWVIADNLRERLAREQLRVVGLRRDGEYRLSAVIADPDRERAQVEINHNKDGIVSAARVIKYLGSDIGTRLRRALTSHDEDP